MTTIETDRLDLVVIDAAYLVAVLDRSPLPDVGFTDATGMFTGLDDVVRLRLDQMTVDPSLAPWLLRALVLRESRVAVGFINFHDGPDAQGRVEVGYEILPEHRRRGYAREAVVAVLDWAAHHGARSVLASVSPDNAASLALVRQLGFEQVGEQIDEVDGLELVFEKSL